MAENVDSTSTDHDTGNNYWSGSRASHGYQLVMSGHVDVDVDLRKARHWMGGHSLALER